MKEDAGALLMSNKEYENTLKQGQGEPLAPKISKKLPKISVKQKKLQAQNNRNDDVKSEQATKSSSILPLIKILKDRPMQQQSFNWFFDPRMPKEWNEMVNAMQGNKMAGQYQKENVFRMAGPEEISKPQ